MMEYRFEENEDSIIRNGEDKLFQVLIGGKQKDFVEFMLTNKYLVWVVNVGSFFKPKYNQIQYLLTDVRIRNGAPEVEIEDDEHFDKVLRIRFKESEIFLGADSEDILDEIRDGIIESLGYRSIMPSNTTVKQFCSQCGSKLIPGARFCSNCGYDLQS